MIEKRIGSHGRLTIKTDGLDRIAASLATKFVARVGVLGQKGATEHAGTKKTNASIGLLHEKGSISLNIPQRSFLQMPLVRNAKEIFVNSRIIEKWIVAAISAGKNPKEAWYKAYKDLGFIGEQTVQHAFEQSGPGWAPNSPVTIAAKGSDKPLIDTGELRRSVTSEVRAR